MDYLTTHIEPNSNRDDELPPFDSDYQTFVEPKELADLRLMFRRDGVEASQAAWWLCQQALRTADSEFALSLAWNQVLSSFALVSETQRITLADYAKQRLLVIRRRAERERAVLIMPQPKNQDTYNGMAI